MEDRGQSRTYLVATPALDRLVSPSASRSCPRCISVSAAAHLPTVCTGLDEEEEGDGALSQLPAARLLHWIAPYGGGGGKGHSNTQLFTFIYNLWIFIALLLVRDSISTNHNSSKIFLSVLAADNLQSAGRVVLGEDDISARLGA